ncbi:hypothetical protein E4U44_008732 [Claviceps purpurea]|nr:hypothetical protein E4U49_000296 [Claviceps purpurea]KAG6303554.1 hypothetical protein E4U44_008732 [Claviceps purpurea]
MEMHCNNILRKIAKSRDDGSFCDLEIVCDKRRFNAHRIVEGTNSIFEIQKYSSVLVERMLDYMYTGTYDELPSKAPAKEGQESSQKAAKLDPAAHVMLHAQMRELGDIYMVEGLSQHACEKLETLLAFETTRNLLVDIVPEVYAFESSTIIRKIIVQSLRKKLDPPPLETDIAETMAEMARVVPEFGSDMLMSYCTASNHGHLSSYPGSCSLSSPSIAEAARSSLPSSDRTRPLSAFGKRRWDIGGTVLSPRQ